MKILIIGCGSIGRRHAQNALNLDAEVGVFDINLEGANALAKELNISSFETLDDALLWKADGVVIASPHTTHVDLAINAIKVGADVMIEKPISNQIDGVDNLLNEAKAEGRHVSVVCNMRFHEAVMMMRQHLDQIGTILYAKAQYGNYLPNMRPNADYRELYCARKNAGGGVILDVIHEIDYLMWLLGSVQTVNCIADKISDLDIDVEDYANINLTHKSGSRSSIHVDYLKPFKRRGCEIVGDQGMIIWQSEGKHPELCSVKIFKNETQEWTNIFESEAIDTNAGYNRLMQAFMMKIKNPSLVTDLSDGSQGLEALRVALKAHQSADKMGVGVE